jgi:activator of Hsp90 ATPase-like protein
MTAPAAKKTRASTKLAATPGSSTKTAAAGKSKARKTPAKKAKAPAKMAARSGIASLAKASTDNAARIVGTLAGVSTAAVTKATGHGWNYWLKALDKAGAAKLPHKQIAQVLYDKLGLRENWWVQMVTVGYEQARGLRKPHQNALGFAASVSRTIGVPIAALFAAWEDGSRDEWLPDAIEVRRQTKNKSMRITWSDGSGVHVNFYSKGGDKAVVSIEHEKLPDETAVEAVKQLWGTTLDRLKATLEGK